MTVFDWFREFLMSRLDRLDMATIHFFLQAALFALCPTVVCSLTYWRNIRIMPVQVSLCVLTWIGVFCIPVDHLYIHDAMTRLWVLAVSLLAICFTPPFLAFLLTSNPQGSQKITQAIYITVILLTVLQLCKGSLLR